MHNLYWNHYTGFQYLSESTSNWQLWLSRYSLLHNLNTFVSWSPVNSLVHRWHCAHQLVLYSKHHVSELHTAAVLLVQPYQLSGTIFLLQSLKQKVCLHSVVDSRHICLLLLVKTVANCNVASVSVSLHTFSFMALYKFVFNFNYSKGQLIRKSIVQIRATVLTFGLRLGTELRLGIGSALTLGLGLVEIVDFRNSGPSK